jgi:hypothetical protein
MPNQYWQGAGGAALNLSQRSRRRVGGPRRPSHALGLPAPRGKGGHQQIRCSSTYSTSYTQHPIKLELMPSARLLSDTFRFGSVRFGSRCARSTTGRIRESAVVGSCGITFQFSFSLSPTGARPSAWLRASFAVLGRGRGRSSSQIVFTCRATYGLVDDDGGSNLPYRDNKVDLPRP